MVSGFFTNAQLIYNKVLMLEKRTTKITVTPTQLITKNITITLPLFTNIKLTLPITNLKEIINLPFEIENNKILIYTVSNYNIKKTIQLESEHMEPICASNTKRMCIDTSILNFLKNFSSCEKLSIHWEDNKMILFASDIITFECSLPCSFKFTNFKILFRDLWFLGYDWTKVVLCLDEIVYFYLYDDESTVIFKLNKVI